MSTPPTPPRQIGQNLTSALEEVIKGFKSIGNSLKGAGGAATGGLESAGLGIETVAAAPVRWAGRFMQNHPYVSTALVAVGLFKVVSNYMEKREAEKNGVLESAAGNELPGVYDPDPRLGRERPKYSVVEPSATRRHTDRVQQSREQPPQEVQR